MEEKKAFKEYWKVTLTDGTVIDDNSIDFLDFKANGTVQLKTAISYEIIGSKTVGRLWWKQEVELPPEKHTRTDERYVIRCENIKIAKWVMQYND